MNACQILLLENYDVSKMRTTIEVLRFYRLYLVYDKNLKGDREGLLDILTNKQLSHLYKVIFRTEATEGATKSEMLYSIENYFIGLV